MEAGTQFYYDMFMARALNMEDAKEPMDFITALTRLQKACGVDIYHPLYI